MRDCSSTTTTASGMDSINAGALTAVSMVAPPPSLPQHAGAPPAAAARLRARLPLLLRPHANQRHKTNIRQVELGRAGPRCAHERATRDDSDVPAPSRSPAHA